MPGAELLNELFNGMPGEGVRLRLAPFPPVDGRKRHFQEGSELGLTEIEPISKLVNQPGQLFWIQDSGALILSDEMSSDTLMILAFSASTHRFSGLSTYLVV